MLATKSELNNELSALVEDENPESDSARPRFQFGLRSLLIVWVVISVILGIASLIARHSDVDLLILWGSLLLLVFGSMTCFFCSLFALLMCFGRGDSEKRNRQVRTIAKIYIYTLVLTFIPPLLLLMVLSLSTVFG